MPIGGISFLTGRINGLVIECNIDVRGLFCPGRKAASQLIITSAIIANIKMLISWLVRPNIVGIISEANKSFFPTRRLAATNSINFSTNINKIAEVSTPPMLGINLRRGVQSRRARKAVYFIFIFYFILCDLCGAACLCVLSS